jgi:hypothetical protein
MRLVLTCLMLVAALPSISGCNYDPNSPAMKAMESPNSCGPGGTQNREACSSRR